MEIINNSHETSDYEEEDNVSQVRDREVPLRNAELSEEVASKAKKKTKRKANQDEKPKRKANQGESPSKLIIGLIFEGLSLC
ncbi:hypothetical protein QL285_036769 [Trifolium repens]|nr:hypothetical protein QL285_036769 [Trifolium repens]